MRPLSILFTNHTLAARWGTELWVRDVARALVARRHRPIAFSLVTGPVAEELRASTVPVVTDLANVTRPPDLIHGHHHLETLIAALYFPGVPIVHFCHGWLPWEEKPLKHPSIVRYVAVDDTCAERLTLEEGIPADRVDVLLNFVDLNRFAPRPPLPARPRRALVFSNQATDRGYTAIIREACREADIDLAIAGAASGRILEHPEANLRETDLVFAKARSALEAMAVGCSVIVTDLPGAGPLVTPGDFAYLRSRNFGIGVLQQRHTVDWYRRQIAAYNPDHAAAVSTLVREGAGLDEAVDRLLDIYQRAIDAHVLAGCEPDEQSIAAQRAAARHLCTIAPTLKAGPATVLRVHQRERELIGAHELYRHALRQMRDILFRTPIVGGAAQHTARWLRALRP
jgi:glycosyltransferase involved in cell wall biosynthesis